MSTEAELLNAVLEHPDDDVPRIAYAKWDRSQSETADQARGEFIQTQIRLTRMEVGGEPDERNDLLDGQRRLLDAHGRHWAGEIGSLADEYFFHRGFVTLVTLPARRFLEVAPRLFALAPIRHLDLTGAAEVAGELFASPHLARIRSLGLDGCGWQDGHMNALADSACLPALRWLSLANNRLGLDGAEVLAASELGKRLIYVGLHGNPVNPCDQYSLDDGNIVGAWLPEEGQLLEKRHGRLAWLHTAGDSIWNLVPDRLAITG